MTRRFIRPASAVFLAVGVAAGCTTDTLEITDPDVLNVNDYATTAGATPLRLGVIQDFQNVFSGNASLESMVVVTGNVSDEMYSTDTFDDRLFPNQRAMNDNLPALDGFYRNLHRARSGATRTINVLRRVAPTPVQNIGEMYNIRGFVETFFAEAYCSGVPFSEEDGTTTEFGQPQTTAQIYTRALASFDSALASAGTDTRVQNIARIGRARVLLNQGRFDDAAAAVAAVPTSFAWVTAHSTGSGRQENGMWNALTVPNSRYAIVLPDAQGRGEGLNGIAFLTTPADPRIPWVPSTRTGFNGSSRNLPTQLKYDRTTGAVVANGIEARLIELEARVRRDNQADRDAVFAGLNNLRATATTPAMAPLPGSAPTTQAAAVSLLFEERAKWLYLTGHRLGDLRRLVRQYGRAANTVFPTGNLPAPLAGVYGNDVNLPIPFDEKNNPKATAGCLDRNP
ncbi:MAG: hypothetical protein ACK6DR_17695 [Gemmatimonas sp.]|uniref:hypothetical protein n=1 Tax=Gemmatimonas sp. TaxID=1962908 RepID=UPI0022BEE580|nr:hypothetical protein [Gemmatimonas sp.]MCE2952856.1 hypothetical protein [Gemmatimonas sp.]MCZ8012076.1 hypothetical protein [Gemmatimonas sp.]MCZ8267396.1 hypothetical protein [Gemmatimonas sp.]